MKNELRAARFLNAVFASFLHRCRKHEAATRIQAALRVRLAKKYLGALQSAQARRLREMQNCLQITPLVPARKARRAGLGPLTAYGMCNKCKSCRGFRVARNAAGRDIGGHVCACGHHVVNHVQVST